MKKLAFKTLFSLIILSACNNGDDAGSDSINPGNNDPSTIDYKQEMREFVIGISEYSKSIKSSFIIIPQNGMELVSNNGEDDDNHTVNT